MTADEINYKWDIFKEKYSLFRDWVKSDLITNRQSELLDDLGIEINAEYNSEYEFMKEYPDGRTIDNMLDYLVKRQGDKK